MKTRSDTPLANRIRRLAPFAIPALAAAACATTVWLPPRIDLGRYGTIGMIELSCDASAGGSELGAFASDRLLATLQDAQPGVPVLELGDDARVLEAVGHDVLDPDAIRAIGERYGVDAVIAGRLEVDTSRPRLSVGGLADSLRAQAALEGSLSARMFETRSGATLWSDAASGRETVAHVRLSQDGLPGFGATDPDGAHARLVRGLVAAVTADFRPRSERR